MMLTQAHRPSPTRVRAISAARSTSGAVMWTSIASAICPDFTSRCGRARPFLGLDDDLPVLESARALLIVQKYGGTSVGTVERIRAVAKRCLATQRKGHDVVVIVSAMSGETNR